MCRRLRGQARSHMGLWHRQITGHTEHCGSELARESGGSAGKDVGCTAVFASRLAPTEVVAPPNHWSTRNIVGASLLAKALGQANRMLNVLPHSRASPLPQVFCGTTKSLVNTEHCGSELARESGGSAGKDFGFTAVFAGKPAPTGFLWHHQIIGQHGTLWERACSRKRWISRQRC
jgi:hypothetical protein